MFVGPIIKTLKRQGPWLYLSDSIVGMKDWALFYERYFVDVSHINTSAGGQTLFELVFILTASSGILNYKLEI